MPVKKVWIVVSDSGLILLSGSKKSRQFYEPTEEFKASMRADVDDLMVMSDVGQEVARFELQVGRTHQPCRTEIWRSSRNLCSHLLEWQRTCRT